MKFIIVVFILYVLAGCAGAPVENSAPILGSISIDAVGPQENYRIQPGDELDIKFFYNEELNETVMVRPDGRISLQLLGELKVHNLAPSELESLLKKRFASQLANPEVTVIVKSFNMYKVFVDGYVERPGAFPLVGFMTVMQSISQAGGLRSGAKKKEILIIRRGEESKPVVHKINLAKAMSGEDLSQDIYLAPFDIVFVPRSSIGNVNEFVDLYLRKNIPIGVGYGVR